MQISVTERWWPTTGIRAAEMLERGADLSDGERAEANAEIEARARREKSPPFVRREQMVLKKSSMRGVWIAEVVSPALGLDTHMLNAEIHHIPAGVHTDKQRHAERVLHVMTGTGYSIIEGERFRLGDRRDFNPHQDGILVPALRDGFRRPTSLSAACRGCSKT